MSKKAGRCYKRHGTKGFPTSFDVVILAEKNSAANGGNGNFVRPANYAVYYPLGLAGNADPLAGQPDMDALSELSGFYSSYFCCSQDKVSVQP